MFYPTHPDRLLVVLTCSKFIMAYPVHFRIPLVFYLILCKIIRLCTYHLIRLPTTTYPSTCAVMDLIGFRVPVAHCILARPFRFSGFIHLLIRGGFFCVSTMHYFSLLVSFAAASQIQLVYNRPRVQTTGNGCESVSPRALICNLQFFISRVNCLRA